MTSIPANHPLVGDGDENVDDEDYHQNDDDDDDDNRLYFYAAVHRLVERKSRSRRIIHRVQPSKNVVTLDRDQEVIISNLSSVIFIITVNKIITTRTSHRGQGSRCQET